MKRNAFELDAKGNISVAPLVSYSTAIAAGMTCLLRLDHAASAQDLAAGRFQATQLALTPAQARSLAQALSKMADAAERQDQSARRQ